MKANDILNEIKGKVKPGKKICRFGITIGIVVIILIAIVLLFLGLTEYKPEATEKLKIKGEGYHELEPNSTFTLMTWNIGYAALGDNADYYKDGGEMVMTADRNRLNKNIKSIQSRINEIKPSIFLMQEIDMYSKRANHVNELSNMANNFLAYNYSYARNIKALYIPYPLPMLGNVDSGIATFSKYKVESAERISLPGSYIWPKSMTNYKRCLLVTRIPIKDSEKQLVLVNVHFEEFTSDKKRNEQIKKLTELLKKEQKKDNYIIVGGDFSQTFSNIDISKYPQKKGNWAPGKFDTKKLKGEWQFLMDTEVPSTRSLDKPYTEEQKKKFQYYITDGFIVSSNIQVNSIKTQDYEFYASDHNPVVLNATLQ